MPYAELTHLEWSKRLRARLYLSGSAAPVPPPGVLGLDRRSFPGATARDPAPWYLPAIDQGDPALQEAIGARYGVDARRVVPVAGASEGHFLVQMLLRGRDGGDALVEFPGYGPHAGVAGAFAGRVLHLPRDAHGRLDLGIVHSAEAMHVRVVTLSDPHNPGGTPLDADDMAALVGWADQRRVEIVVDEVFREADPDRAPGSWAAVHPARVWGVSSLTKGFGLGALRLGWVIAPPDQAEALRRIHDYTTVLAPGPSVALARQVMANADRARAWVLARMAPNRQYFAAHGGWPTPGTTAFVRVLPRGRRGRALAGGAAGVDEPPDTTALCRDLLEVHGVAVVPGVFFGDPSGFRIGFGADRKSFREGWKLLRRELRARGLEPVR